MGKYYITTAIDYVNGPPHIGHALEKIQADVLARFHRAKGSSVFFLTGTDEHGAKILRAAKAKGVPVAQFTDELSERFRAMKEALNLSWDDFIRTSDAERHWPGAKLMWEKLAASGDIYKKSYQGLYCVGHEAFVTPKDLVDGKCIDHKTVPEVVKEENYFFRLSKYSKTIGEKIRSGELAIIPESRKNEILSLIDHPGLEDVSFSRPRKDLPWGVPVPGDDTQTMYVWSDALVNYISAIGFGRNDEWKKWWPADVQVIGKDILRFHAAIWPGMLLSAGITLPKCLFVHGFITVENEKMSKTVGNVIDPIELVKKYGTDAVRYYLLREIPAGADGDFSPKKFEALYNADLANGIGNFAARVLALGSGMGDLDGGTVPDKEIAAKIAETRGAVEKAMQDFQFHEALAAIWNLVSYGDAFVNSSAPWKIEDAAKKKQVVFDLVVLLDNISAMLAPFLPATAAKITKQIVWERKILTTKKGEALFPRLT